MIWKRESSHHYTWKSTGIPLHAIRLHKKGKVKICMYKYNNKMISELPTDMNGSAKTTATRHLFSVNPEAKYLPESQTDIPIETYNTRHKNSSSISVYQGTSP